MFKKVGKIKIVKRPKSRVAAVDFDGTLCTMFHYDTPYIPKQVITDKPNPEVVKLCNALHRKGVKIVIYSARFWGEYYVIEQWLKKNKVKYDDIILGKFKADVYIDDIAVNHTTDELWQYNVRKLLKILNED